MSNIIAMVDDVATISNEFCKELIALQEEEKAIKSALAEAKDNLLLQMEKYGVKSFDNDLIKVTYTAPKVQKRLDSKSLQAEMPEVYDSYLKEIETSASVRITVR